MLMCYYISGRELLLLFYVVIYLLHMCIYHSFTILFLSADFNSASQNLCCSETAGSTPELGKKPFYQRMQSVPVETLQEPVKKIPRSHSHPGALPKLIQKPKEESDLEQSPSQPFRSPRTHKYLKQGYGKFCLIMISSCDFE